MSDRDIIDTIENHIVIETTCEYLAAGNCASSVDGFCIGGTSEGQCHG